MNVLLVGAGALGGELASLLPRVLPRDSKVTIVDGDTVELSNVPRQSLLAPNDAGLAKARVVASYLCRNGMQNVTAAVSAVEELPLADICAADVVLCAVDSVLCRRWLNRVFVTEVFGRALERNGAQTHASKKDMRAPLLIEGGTEGLLGHARFVVPGHTACIECMRDMFSGDESVPAPCSEMAMQSLASECVHWAGRVVEEEYASAHIRLSEMRSQALSHLCDHDMDTVEKEIATADVEPYEKESLVRALAIERARAIGISVRDVEHVLSVKRAFIPAVATTTLAVAARMASYLTMHVLDAALPEECFWFYNGSTLHTNAVALSPDESCPVCGEFQFKSYLSDKL